MIRRRVFHPASRWRLNRVLLALSISWPVCAGAAANEISCAKSAIAFDYTAYSGGYEFICKKETVDEDAFDQMRARKERNWQELIEFGKAFLPANSLVEETIMSSSEGRYGSAYMVTAIGPVHLTEPSLRTAIEAITRMNVLGGQGKVDWHEKQAIGDYSVDFYGQTFPESNVGGGPRECMGFVRYLKGSPDSHAQRVIGTYCEIGAHALDAKRAQHVLDTLLVHPEAVQ
ncbi:MAG TPA: hypothetical protein VGQ35_04250 [Dongiaceae bacterium]|nr:hypothetical protein [Dongiaceae bacterium]